MRLLARVLFILVFGRFAQGAEDAGQWIVVTSPELRPALEPLIADRGAEGFKVVILDTGELLSQEQRHQGNGTLLKKRVEGQVQGFKGRSYLLLAGPFNTAGLTNSDNIVLPALRGAVGRMKGEPSDSGYGLPGDDGMSRMAVGRLPARNRGELSGMVQKTLEFEHDVKPAPWRNRLALLLGNPGGGMLAEMFMQQSLKAHLAPLHPSWQVRTVFNVASSPFYLPRPQDREAAVRYIEEGDMFSIYCGHSGPAGMGMDERFIPRKDWATLNIVQGRGPFFTCGCFCCQMKGTNEAYGVAAVRNPAGPVAVIGAMEESFSAPGQLAVEGFLSCLTNAPFPPRLGDYWLSVQAGLARGGMDAATFAMMDVMDGTEGKVPLATQRQEHLEMWLLLGDPALRMPVVPADIPLKAQGPLVCGKTIEISGGLPRRLSGAEVRLTIERPLTSEPIELEMVPKNSQETREARVKAFEANHQRANSFVVSSALKKSVGTNFSVSMKLGDAMPWSNVVIRATATVSNEMGFGVLVLPVGERMAENGGAAH